MKLGTESQRENCASTAVTVTEDHVLRGSPGDCYSCAVALAIKDHVRPGITVHIAFHTWQLRRSGNWRAYDHFTSPQPLPLPTQHFIHSLDAEVDVDLPHTFTVHIPNEYLKGELG